MIAEENKVAWATELKSVPRNADEISDQKFWDLVDMADGSCDKFVAKVLFSTFSDSLEDNGTQEAVVRVLGSVEPTIRCEALLEELPRLKIEGPEWASILVYGEAKFHSEALFKAALNSSQSNRSLLRVLLQELAKEAQADGAPDLFTPIARRVNAASN